MNNNGIEIERKFLIRHPGEQWLSSQPGSRRVNIVQTYLLSEDGASRRVRSWEEGGHVCYIKTVKRMLSALSREEAEEEINREEYDALLREMDPERKPVVKTRWCIPYSGHTLEIDHYESWWEDLSILEIELSSEGEAYSIPPDLEVIREVTGDRRYLNSSMAREMPPRG